jgi:hypothetical protein
MRSAKLFKFPACSIHTTFQSYLLPAVGVFDGNVLLALTVDVKASFPERGQHVGTVADGSSLHLRLDVGIDRLPRLFLLLLGGIAPPPGQPRLDNVCLARRKHPCPIRVVRPCPAVPDVLKIAERGEILLPPRRESVERLARGQFHAGDDEVQLVVSGMAVPHPEDVVLIRSQPGEGDGLEVVPYLRFFFW